MIDAFPIGKGKVNVGVFRFVAIFNKTLTYTLKGRCYKTTILHQTQSSRYLDRLFVWTICRTPV
jgi:hypothetical protein